MAGDQAAPAAVLSRTGGNPEGAPVLFIHGFGADRLSWLATAPALFERHDVWTVDLPGHGAAPAETGDGSLATLADAVAAAAAPLGDRGLHLVGHSLGGGIALELARRRPDGIRSLALIAPAGLGTGLDADFLTAFPELAEPAAARETLERLVARPRLINAPMVTHVLGQLERPGVRAGLRAIARALLERHDDFRTAAADVAGLPVPRLVLWGDEDGINPASSEALADFGGLLLTMPATRHLPHVEALQKVNAALAHFLDRA